MSTRRALLQAIGYVAGVLLATCVVSFFSLEAAMKTFYTTLALGALVCAIDTTRHYARKDKATPP